MKELGYGKAYRYARGGFAAGETYLPDGMADPALGMHRHRAGWRDRSARSWRICASWIARRRENSVPTVLRLLNWRFHFCSDEQ